MHPISSSSSSLKHARSEEGSGPAPQKKSCTGEVSPSSSAVPSSSEGASAKSTAGSSSPLLPPLPGEPKDHPIVAPLGLPPHRQLLADSTESYKKYETTYPDGTKVMEHAHNFSDPALLTKSVHYGSLLSDKGTGQFASRLRVSESYEYQDGRTLYKFKDAEAKTSSFSVEEDSQGRISGRGLVPEGETLALPDGRNIQFNRRIQPPESQGNTSAQPTRSNSERAGAHFKTNYEVVVLPERSSPFLPPDPSIPRQYTLPGDTRVDVVENPQQGTRHLSVPGSEWQSTMGHISRMDFPNGESHFWMGRGENAESVLRRTPEGKVSMVSQKLHSEAGQMARETWAQGRPPLPRQEDATSIGPTGHP